MAAFFKRYEPGTSPFDALEHRPSPNGLALLGGALAWFECKVSGEHASGDHVVVFGTGDGRVVILALTDGSERWTVELGSEIGGSVAVAGGWIYAAGLDGRVVAFGPAPGEQEAAAKVRGE